MASDDAFRPPHDGSATPPAEEQEQPPKPRSPLHYILRRPLGREVLVARLGRAHQLDLALFRRINGGHRHPRLDQFYYAVAFVFNGGWAWLIGVALFLPFRRSRAKARALLRLITLPIWVAALGVEGPIKRYFRRSRPFHSQSQVIIIGRRPGNWSFPSGHAAATFAGARMLQRALPRWAWLWYSIAGLVAYSRVYLGVHYPGDVVSGALFGTLLAEITQRVQRRLGQYLNRERTS